MALDIIGKIYDLSGDAENPTVTELAGWHVNSTELLHGLEYYLIELVTPRRVFMGVDTYCYKFDSEQQANELLELE
jgi:hypothetical protein